MFIVVSRFLGHFYFTKIPKREELEEGNIPVAQGTAPEILSFTPARVSATLFLYQGSISVSVFLF